MCANLISIWQTKLSSNIGKPVATLDILELRKIVFITSDVTSGLFVCLFNTKYPQMSRFYDQISKPSFN